MHRSLIEFLVPVDTFPAACNNSQEIGWNFERTRVPFDNKEWRKKKEQKNSKVWLTLDEWQSFVYSYEVYGINVICVSYPV